MNELQKVFDGQELRMVEAGEEFHFALKDVCSILELSPRVVKQRLEKDVCSTYPLQTAGGKQNVTFVNEDGLYDVILDSRKKEAKQFRKWITKEVLPSIRKTGGYEVTKHSYMIEDPIERAKKWIEEQQEKQMLEQRVAEYEPKISYLDSILGSTDTVTTSQIAADYGMSANKLNKLLHEFGVQYKINGQWLLYSKHKGEGYTKSKTTEVQKKDGTTKVVMNTRWRQKGRLFIYETLKKHDIYPLMDLEGMKKEQPTAK